MPAISGPTIAVVANPNNPETKLLLVMGRTPEWSCSAAADPRWRLGSSALTGQTQVVGNPDHPVAQGVSTRRAGS